MRFIVVQRHIYKTIYFQGQKTSSYNWFKEEIFFKSKNYLKL